MIVLQSFFGRSYNNLNSIQECKNGNSCVINKKNRTTCKACRLRKCLYVGMSKSGSRYGRRSNWFKIHCLLQEQNQQMQMSMQSPSSHNQQSSSTSQQIPEVDNPELEESKNLTPPCISSPESHNSDSSVEVTERRSYSQPPMMGYRELPSTMSKDMMTWARDMMGSRLPMMSFMPHPALMQSSGLTVLSPYHLYSHPLIANFAAATNRVDLGVPYKMDQVAETSRNRPSSDDNFETNREEAKLQKASRYVVEENWKERLTPDPKETQPFPVQDNPIDLSLKRKR